MKAAENYHVSEQYVTRGVLPPNLFRHARKDFVLFNAMLFFRVYSLSMHVWKTKFAKAQYFSFSSLFFLFLSLHEHT